MNNLSTKELISLLNLYKDFGIEDFLEEAPIVRTTKNKVFEQVVINQQQKQELTQIASGEIIDSKLKEYTSSLVENIFSLDELESAVKTFKHLSICKTATKTVFADGNKNAKIMLIGEAPGEQEDLSGIPFCGESGMLLDSALSFINLSRKSNLYITNTVFWRPPGNRKPTDFELEVCKPFLQKHIALINPEILILCGATSANYLLENDLGITSLKNTQHSYTNKYLQKPIKVFAIYHPSYLLRQPMKKKEFWADLLKIESMIAI